MIRKNVLNHFLWWVKPDVGKEKGGTHLYCYPYVLYVISYLIVSLSGWDLFPRCPYHENRFNACGSNMVSVFR